MALFWYGDALSMQGASSQLRQYANSHDHSAMHDTLQSALWILMHDSKFRSDSVWGGCKISYLLSATLLIPVITAPSTFKKWQVVVVVQISMETIFEFSKIWTLEFCI